MKCVLFHIMKEHSHDNKGVVMLQICMGLIKVEPDSGSEECVTSLDNGTEEGSVMVGDSIIKVQEDDIIFDESDREVKAADIKVEELVDIKEENPEPIKFPPIKTEPEVSVWGLCVRQQQFMLPRPFTATKSEHPKIHFNYPYVCTLHLYSLLDQQIHNVYIDNKFLYRNLTTFVTFAI